LDRYWARMMAETGLPIKVLGSEVTRLSTMPYHTSSGGVVRRGKREGEEGCGSGTHANETRL
jgi:hypothetical protein